MASNLQEITGKESGSVMYEDGSINILNWSSIDGLPRLFAGAPLGLGEELKASRTATPAAAKKAMMDHVRDQGDTPPTRGYKSWTVKTPDTTAIVTIQEDWH